jgi:hypothetical protein
MLQPPGLRTSTSSWEFLLWKSDSPRRLDRSIKSARHVFVKKSGAKRISVTQIWPVIRANLKQGTLIRNWTAAKGNFGEDFAVTAVTDGYVVVEAPGATTEQRVPRADFEAVHKVWDQYCAASIQRHRLRDTTRFSKYVISILHHVAA